MRQPLKYSVWRLAGDIFRTPALLFFAAFFVLQGLDISKDYAVVNGVALRDWAGELGADFARWEYGVVGAFAVAVFVGILRIPYARRVTLPAKLKKFLFLLFIFTATGIISGLTGGNQPAYVLLETSNWLIYLGLPAFALIVAAKGAWRAVYAVLLVYVFMIMGKTLLSFVTDFSTHINYLKVFIRGNFFMIPLFFTVLSFALYKRKTLAFLPPVLVLGVLLLTGMRGNFIGVLAGLIYFFTFPEGKKIRFNFLFVALFIVSALLLLGYITGLPLANLLGFWGDTWENGLNYRRMQFDQLMMQFCGSPLWGKGFGLVLFDFAGYDVDLSKPYLQELEWINFLSKTGLIGLMSLLGAFVVLLNWMKGVFFSARTQWQRAVIQGLACGLVAMLTATLSNTLISSILFHFYIFCLVAITLGIYHESISVDKVVSEESNSSTLTLQR